MIFRTHSIPAGLLSLLFFAALPVSVAALEAPSGEALAHGDAAFRLDDGAVVGPDKHLVFVLEPGGLAARSIESGELAWRRDTALKPLGFLGANLVAFEARPDSRRAVLRFLDPATGQTADTIELAFPAPARPLLADRPDETFEIRAWRDEADLIVDWEHISMPLKGMPATADGQPAPPGGALTPPPGAPGVGADRRTRSEGKFRVNVVDGAATLLGDDDPVAPAPSIDVQVDTGTPRSVENAERTFQSRDGAHRLVSERASREAWARYQWTLTDSSGATTLGKVRLPLAYAPFFVAGNRLVHLAPPVIRRAGADAEFIAQGRRIRALALGDGRELWSVPLADKEYRGELPP